MILTIVLVITLAALICYISCYAAAKADEWDEKYWAPLREEWLEEDDYEPKHAKH